MIKPKPTDAIQDPLIREHMQYLQDEAQGKPLALEAAPTADVPLLQNDEDGVYNNVYYKRRGNVILVFNPSSTIVIP